MRTLVLVALLSLATVALAVPHVFVIDGNRDAEVIATVDILKTATGRDPVFWGMNLDAQAVATAQQTYPSTVAYVIGHGSAGEIAGTPIGLLYTLLGRQYTDIRFFACALPLSSLLLGAVSAVTEAKPAALAKYTKAVNNGQTFTSITWVPDSELNKDQKTASGKLKTAVKAVAAIADANPDTALSKAVPLANALLAKSIHFTDVINIVQLDGKAYFWCAPDRNACPHVTTLQDCSALYIKYGKDAATPDKQIGALMKACIASSKAKDSAPCTFYDIAANQGMQIPAVAKKHKIVISFAELESRLYKRRASIALAGRKSANRQASVQV